jgi:hypothetical protein
MPAKTSKTRTALFFMLLLGVAAVALIAGGACKKESHTAGKESREAFEKSQELLKEGLAKTKDATKEGVDQTKAAAKEFSKGWKEGGK